jgi:hypothetical protein
LDTRKTLHFHEIGRTTLDISQRPRPSHSPHPPQASTGNNWMQPEIWRPLASYCLTDRHSPRSVILQRFPSSQTVSLRYDWITKYVHCSRAPCGGDLAVHSPHPTTSVHGISIRPSNDWMRPEVGRPFSKHSLHYRHRLGG